MGLRWRRRRKGVGCGRLFLRYGEGGGLYGLWERFLYVCGVEMLKYAVPVII